MPELPEVETIRQQIQQSYLHATIAYVKAQPVRIFQNVSPSRFSRALKDKKIMAVQRYGKLMYWKVEKVFPVFHLGMSGIFISDTSLSLYPQHIHISFYFDDGRTLHFQDVRKFSKIFLYHQPPSFFELGIDPLSKNFTLNNFKKLLTLKKMAIKNLLMDQHIIAGIGNIYANEILFRSRIHPLRPANSLTLEEISDLFKNIRAVLSDAIDHFGTSYTAYRTIEGERGENQNFLNVYQKTTEPCLYCGRPIQKMIVNSRSTFYCPICQK